MPWIRHMPPHARFFARLERFQCACPHCGRVMLSTQDQGHLSKNLMRSGRLPRPEYLKRGARSVKSARQLVWNPYTQRLTCPWCKTVFVAGLLLYPSTPKAEAPSDTRPVLHERLELARLVAGGYHIEEAYHAGQPVNYVVPEPCSCPEKGWSSDCPIHGTPAAAPTAEVTPHPRGGGDMSFSLVIICTLYR